MYIITSKTNLLNLASEITSKSSTYGDEIDSVVAALTELRSDANRFGTEFVRDIPTMWGESVTVKAIPMKRISSWIF